MKGDCKCAGCGHCRKYHTNGTGRCTICLRCGDFL